MAWASRSDRGLHPHFEHQVYYIVCAQSVHLTEFNRKAPENMAEGVRTIGSRINRARV